MKEDSFISQAQLTMVLSLFSFPEAHLRGVQNQGLQEGQEMDQEKDNQLTTILFPL